MANNKKPVLKKAPVAGPTKGKEIVENIPQGISSEPLPEPEIVHDIHVPEGQVQPAQDNLDLDLDKKEYISEGPGNILDAEINSNDEAKEEEGAYGYINDVCECIKEPRNLTDCIDMQNMITEFLDEYRTSLVDGGIDSSKLNRLNLAINHSGMTEHNLKIQRDTLQAEL